MTPIERHRHSNDMRIRGMERAVSVPKRHRVYPASMSKWFREGALCRANGKPFTACPRASVASILLQEWRSGWKAMDEQLRGLDE